MLKFLRERFTEQSTWRGVFVLASLVGVNLSPDMQSTIVNVAVTAIGIADIVTREKK